MSNVSFKLDAYRRIHDQRFIFAAVLALCYPISIVANMLIIYAVCVEKHLHKPMYMLICNLACINLYGCVGLTPFILVNIFSGTFQISWLACFVQIFSVHTFGGCEITNLMVMAYDRYIAICFPLNYEKIMSSSIVWKCIAFTWLMPFCRVSITLAITSSLEICGTIIEKVYCDNYSVVKLACSDTSSINIYGPTFIVFYLVVPFFLIFYSYIKIILISLKFTKVGQIKALNTCLPHVVAIINFIIGCSFELFQSRFDMSHVPYTLRVTLSLYFLILSPVLNPVIYGARTQRIKDVIKTKRLFGKILQIK